MSALRLIFASLAYHWRVQLAVAGGVVAGTAVITGALFVGDSMQGSLHDLTLQRLGRIDEALVADRFFRASWPANWPNSPRSAATSPTPCRRFSCGRALETPERDPPILANRVNLIGCDQRFWQLFSTPVGNALSAVPGHANRPLPARGTPQRAFPTDLKLTPTVLPFPDGQVVLNEPLARQLRRRRRATR